MGRGIAMATTVIGVLLALFVLLENSGAFTPGVIAMIIGGVLMSAGGFAALRSSRMEYLAAIWGIYLGLTLGPVISTAQDASSNADSKVAFTIALAMFSVGLVLLILALVAANNKEKAA